ncbi:MAG: response regulator [Candidatus Binataceae bacterium]
MSDTTLELETPAPASPALADIRTLLRTGSGAQHGMPRIVRNGLVAIAVFEAMHILFDLGRYDYTLPGVVVFHGGIALVCIAAFIVTVLPPTLPHWRGWAFSISAISIVLLARFAALDGSSEPLALMTVLFILGASALVPWSPRWQAALTAIALIAMALAAKGTAAPLPRLGFEWIAIIAAAAISHLSAIHGAQVRAEMEQQRQALADSHRHLLEMVIERKQIAAAHELERRRLAESEEILHRFVEAFPDRLAVTNLADGRFILANHPTWAGGYSREDLLGGTATALGIWADPAQFRRFAQQFGESGRVDSMEVAIRRKDGSVAPYLISASKVEIGGKSCAISVTRDISQLKHTEEELRGAREELAHQMNALRLSEATFRRVFSANIDCMTIVAMPEGIYLDVNGEFERSTGYRREEVIGRHFSEFNFFADPDRMAAYAGAIVRDGEVRNMELTFRRKDGTEYPCLVSAALMELRGRTACLTVTRDITELKRTQHELIAAREAAISASESKSAFLSSMSHEIRTPLSAILGMTDLLAETSLDDEQRRYANTIIGNGNALLELINGILDLAKVESGRLHLETVAFDLRETVEHALDTLALRAHEKNLELMAHFAPEVPALVAGDPFRLRQVLVNLAGNAIKFTDSGQVLLSIEPDAPGMLKFSVADTGIGIPADKIPALFNAFTQADTSTTRKYGGSGLGLAIVARLIALMGGETTVQSRPGQGSTFSFTARLAPADAAAANPAPAAGDANLRGMRVLLADDNPVNRSILAEILAQAGAEVTQAESGAAVLAALERAREINAPFRTALIDGRMPDMAGYEIAKNLVSSPHCREVLVMMLTTDALTKEVARLRAIGVANYLVKPVKRSELLSALARTLEPQVSGAEASADAAAVPPASPGAPAPAAAPLRILLVDDSPDNRALIRAYLRRMPYAIVEAENGLDATEKFAAQSFDLVLMDIRMPIMDGYDAARRIREFEAQTARPRTPIIALTASVLDDAVHRTFEAGCDAHVSKPVKKATLLEAIRIATHAGGAPDHYRNGAIATEASCQTA